MEKKSLKGRLDYVSMIIPLLGVVLLCVLFMLMPAKSSYIIQMIRGFLGNDCGIYYALLGVGIFVCSLYIAFSKYGKIKLGKNTDQPEYSSFNWGVMIFTSTMAADILFYSLCEWALYANEKYIDQLGGIQKWASTFPLFHWGPIAWSFYIILAVAFGFMLHVRGRNKQKFSEGCRPLLGNKVDGVVGKIIDLIAIFALIAGTATTFSLASLGLLLLVITMIAFYSTTFDALTMVVSSYSYKKLDVDEEPDKKIRVFWAIIFILFPIALIFAENSMYSLQSVAIIAAFPIGFIILLIVISFFKDANKYLQEEKENNRDIE